MKKQVTVLCIATLLLTGCASRPDAEKSTASVLTSAGTAIAGAVNAPNLDEIAELAEQDETAIPPETEKSDQQSETTAEQATEPPSARESTSPTQAASELSEAAPMQPETPVSIPQDSPAPVQPESEPAPAPQPPARPAFDAGTVISMACSQIGGMTRVNGAEQGMGSFTHSFSVYETQEAIASGLASVMAQERDLYGNTYYDIVYCGESGGTHTFRCYRA